MALIHDNMYVRQAIIQSTPGKTNKEQYTLACNPYIICK